MIDVQSLCAVRGARAILQNYSFGLQKGNVMAILGANGVGKTTLLACLTGVLKPSAGRVSIGGRIGFVPQLFEVSFSYSALDIALMGRARHLGLFGTPGRRDYDIVRDFFDLLGIQHLENQTFSSLSGGQRQLVMIAQALSSECEVLILDEPCAALDYKNQDKVLQLLDTLQRDYGMTVVFSTHMPQHAVEIATHVLLMAGRSDFTAGPVENVLDVKHLTDLYGLPIGRAEIEGHARYTFAPLFGSKDPSHHG